MPHDMNGTLISVGDNVMIPCKIKSMTLDENYCNITVETRYPMPPNLDRSQLTLNAKQVVKIIQ